MGKGLRDIGGGFVGRKWMLVVVYRPPFLTVSG